MNAQVFLVVAVAVIMLFKHADTPGAFLRHQVGGRAFEAGAGSTILCDIRSGTTLRFRRGTSTWFGPAPSYLMLVYTHAF